MKRPLGGGVRRVLRCALCRCSSLLPCPSPSFHSSSRSAYHSHSALLASARPAPAYSPPSAPPPPPLVDVERSPARPSDFLLQRRLARLRPSEADEAPLKPAVGRSALSAEARQQRHEAALAKAVDISDVWLVNDRASAKAALNVLTSEAMRSRVHAVDTEVMGIDVLEQSPVHHGRVTAVTVYAGPDVRIGSEEKGEGGPRIFVDCLDSVDGCDVLAEFREYLEDERVHKIFHNYSFDYHVLLNEGIRVRGFSGDTMHMARLWDTSRSSYSLEALSGELLGAGKHNLRERFSVKKKKKDGMEGKALELPPIEDIQRGSQRSAFIDYATFDAESTWKLRYRLEHELRNQPNPAMQASMDGPNMWSWYQTYYVPFAELLVEMERVGVFVRAKDYLPQLQERAEEGQREAIAAFLSWAERYEPNARFLNVHSNAQKKHLFFAPRGQEEMFERDNDEGYIEPGKKKAKKKVQFALHGWGMQPIALTKGKDAAVSVDVLRKLSGRPDAEPPHYGTAYAHFAAFDERATEEDGVKACQAMAQLTTLSALSTTLNTFLVPLQQQIDAHSRVHCSLNLNTETGRLSSRRPNLQNQPALEKDRFRIRDAFAAPPGRRLIVADYGQLELRVLAHMTNCSSMIAAFQQGGDFHSRTAMGMYAHVREAVERGEVALEGDASASSALPRLKDVFGSERRKAKTLNFSIAYGKTARGLASDWGTSVAEAERTLQAWYADRPEVQEWQRRTIEEAHVSGYSRTLMGRYRLLKGINGKDRALRAHMERAAINTPIQGGAADIVMAAMLKLHKHPRLSQLQWQLVLQIHDEVIVEGPEESVDEALHIVKQCMATPFTKPLSVQLVVDAKGNDTAATAAAAHSTLHTPHSTARPRRCAVVQSSTITAAPPHRISSLSLSLSLSLSPPSLFPCLCSPLSFATCAMRKSDSHGELHCPATGAPGLPFHPLCPCACADVADERLLLCFSGF